MFRVALFGIHWKVRRDPRLAWEWRECRQTTALALSDFQYPSTFGKKPEELLCMHFYSFTGSPFSLVSHQTFAPPLLLTPCLFGRVRRGKTTGEWPAAAGHLGRPFTRASTNIIATQECAAGTWPPPPRCPSIMIVHLLGLRKCESPLSALPRSFQLYIAEHAAPVTGWVGLCEDPRYRRGAAWLVNTHPGPAAPPCTPSHSRVRQENPLTGNLGKWEAKIGCMCVIGIRYFASGQQL